MPPSHMKACWQDFVAFWQSSFNSAFYLRCRHRKPHTKVRVRRGCLAGTPSTSIYACGVTMAGLINRRKKKPPMSEQMA